MSPVMGGGVAGGSQCDLPLLFFEKPVRGTSARARAGLALCRMPKQWQPGLFMNLQVAVGSPGKTSGDAGNGMLESDGGMNA